MQIDFNVDEILGAQLLSIHNIRYLTHLMEQIKQAIREDRLLEFREEYLKLIDSYLQAENLPEVYLCTLPKIYYEDGTTLEIGVGENVEKISNVIRAVANERGYARKKDIRVYARRI